MKLFKTIKKNLNKIFKSKAFSPIATLRTLLTLGLISLLLLILPKTVLSAPPENFQTSIVVGSGLEGPSGFEIAPDGRIFILQRTGEIKIYKNGQLLPQNFVVLPSIATGDRGLIGIAFDPDYLSNHYVYFYYTGLDKLNRLVRFDASGDVATSGQFILYQTSFPSEQLHVGGSIRFGLDGKLYFAVGDNGYPPNAQNLSNPHGKILRINKDGSIPQDNPFVGVPGALPEIWAYGFRNPWRFQFDSVTGRMYGGDVGDFTTEEVNHIVKGGNYGWPYAEGRCVVTCPYIEPLYTWDHNGESAASTGGPIYRGTMFPEEYRNNFYFADYAKGFIKRMTLDANGGNAGVVDFDPVAGTVVDMKVGNDGALYYVTYIPGRIYKITYSVDNQIPVAVATSNKTKGTEPLTVNFSSAGSYDPDGDPIHYVWTFGDGTSSNEANPIKTYTQKGTYTAELAVSDGQNVGLSIPIIIQVGLPPSVTIAVPQDGSNYRAGDTISYQAFATDAAGFDLDDGDIVTEVVLHHDTHIHPFYGPFPGRAGSFTVPNINGEPSPNTWFEIVVTATDESGLATRKSNFIYPLKSKITLSTQPAGLQMTLDGIPQGTPEVIEGVEGYKREVNTPFVQVLNGNYYHFASWSDGGAKKHLMTVPTNDTAIAATFRPVNSFTGQYFNNMNLEGAPVFTRQDKFIDFPWNDDAPDPRIPANAYSVRWTGTQTFPAGRYKFTTSTDDGVRLYIDGQLIIDEWHDQGTISYDGVIDLTAGDHTIIMEYFEHTGGAIARLTWDQTEDQPGGGPEPTPTPTPTPAANTSFTGQYFANKTLAGAPVLTRTDASINFIWNDAPAAPEVGADNYSVRWTKNQLFEAGQYEFVISGDDGIRLFIDDVLQIDGWKDQAMTTYRKTVNLPAGVHKIVVEYYENGGGSVAVFDYSKVGEYVPPVGTPTPAPTPTPPSSTGYTGQYFTNTTLAGAPALTRTDTSINFVWDNNAPAATIPADNYSVRWARTVLFDAGQYEFVANADDGVRVFLDDVQIIDGWKDQAMTRYTKSVSVPGGNHLLRVEYYEKSGGAVMQFSYNKTGDYVPVPTPTPTPLPQPVVGYKAEYWNVPGLGNAPAMPTTPATLVQVDADINFEWNDTPPAPAINADNYIVRWTKKQFLPAGTYEFTTESDDGIRVFIDGEAVINQWNDHGRITHKGQKTLAEGEHDIRVEFYEHGGGAIAIFKFEKIGGGTDPLPTPTPTPTPTPGPIPGAFTGEYFDNQTLTGTPKLTRQDAAINFVWNNDAPAAEIPADHFSVRWTKQQTFAAGSYTFKLKSDDGIRFWVDDQLVVEDWTDHAMKSYEAVVTLAAGIHTLKVEYYENDGGALAILEY